MKKKKKSRQETLWIPHDAVASSPGHPFYEELERVLREEEFNSFVESKCSPYYAKKQGRPSIPPGVYFRMLLIGYFERIDSERGICWRCSDSLSLRQFLGLGMEERTPDHSSLSRIRNRLPLEVHESVFGWVLEVLASRGMIDGKTLGVDATTLEANAALRSIVRRDTGESYESYLKELARKSGIEEPSRADIAKLDKKRPKKGSNKEWVNPNEPDAEIMKMKSGGTDMAHKAEHAVDMSGEGAVIAVTLHGGAKGDTKSLPDTLEKAQSNLQELANNAEYCERIHEDAGREVVGDKGYHGNDILVELVEQEYRSYISEPERGGRKWKDKQAEQAATYANRRRIRGTRGKDVEKSSDLVLLRFFDGRGMITPPPKGLFPVAKASNSFGEVSFEKPGEEGHLFDGAHSRQNVVVVAHKAERMQLDNGCKEGLVASPLEWPGVSSAPALYRGETTMQGTWYDRTAQYRARLRGEYKLFPSTETVHLTPLPFLQERSVDEQRAFYVEAVQDIELKTAQMHQENGTTPMGARAIRRQKPHDKPKAFKAFPRADYPRREPGGLLGDVQRAQGQGGRLSRRCQTFEARRDGRALSRGVFSSTTPFRGKPGPYLTRFSLHPLVVFHRPEMPFVCPQSDFSRKNQRFEFGTALRR